MQEGKSSISKLEASSIKKLGLIYDLIPPFRIIH